VRESRAVFDHTGVRFLTREYLFEKSFRVRNRPILREHPDNLAQRVWHFPGAQLKNDLFFVEKISQRDSHSDQRFIGLSDKASYPVK
jgi:hypothetical protein